MASPSRHYDNSLNPAWRNATVHVLVQESWAADTAGRDADELTEAMSDVAYNLRELAPDSGAYINEVSYIDYLSSSGTDFRSVEILSQTGRRLCTARITPVCSPSSINTIQRASSGAKVALQAMSGTRGWTGDSANSRGLRLGTLGRLEIPYCRQNRSTIHFKTIWE
jgi:hypothetical protein